MSVWDRCEEKDNETWVATTERERLLKEDRLDYIMKELDSTDPSIRKLVKMIIEKRI